MFDTITWVDVVGNLAFITAALSFMMKKMVFLRIWSIFSSILSVIFYLYVADTPVWIPVFWISLFILIHFWGLWGIYQESRPVSISPALQAVLATTFPRMSARNFEIWRGHAVQVALPKDGILFEQGQLYSGVWWLEEGVVMEDRGQGEQQFWSEGLVRGDLGLIMADPIYRSSPAVWRVVSDRAIIRVLSYQKAEELFKKSKAIEEAVLFGVAHHAADWLRELPLRTSSRSTGLSDGALPELAKSGIGN